MYVFFCCCFFFFNNSVAFTYLTLNFSLSCPALVLFFLIFYDRSSLQTRSRSSTNVPPRLAAGLCLAPSHSLLQTVTAQVWHCTSTKTHCTFTCTCSVKPQSGGLLYIKCVFTMCQGLNVVSHVNKGFPVLVLAGLFRRITLIKQSTI